MHVFAKFLEDRLERGLEAQAFSGREIGGDDDVLDFFVRHLVDVDLTATENSKERDDAVIRSGVCQLPLFTPSETWPIQT